MCYECNTVERSRNHCCNGNVTLRSLHTSEPHAIVNKTKIPRFFMNAFMANLGRRNNETHCGLHVKCWILFNQIWSWSTDFHKSSQYKIPRKFVQ